MKLKKLSLQKDTLLPLDGAEAMNIAGGLPVPVPGTILPQMAGVNACGTTGNLTNVGPRCGGGTATCGTCATNCGTCGTCATNCGTCGTCGCTPVTHVSDCRCYTNIPLQACQIPY